MMTRIIVEEIVESVRSTFRGFMAELPVTIAITATAIVAKVIVNVIM